MDRNKVILIKSEFVATFSGTTGNKTQKGSLAPWVTSNGFLSIVVLDYLIQANYLFRASNFEILVLTSIRNLGLTRVTTCPPK